MFEPTVLFQGYFYGQNLETFKQMRSFVQFPVAFLWKGFQGSFQKFSQIGVLQDCFIKHKLCYMGPYYMVHIECSSFLYDCSRILPYECGLHSSKYCTYKCSWSPTVGRHQINCIAIKFQSSIHANETEKQGVQQGCSHHHSSIVLFLQ